MIDGRLDDGCWQSAARAEGFTDELLGTPVADQTVVYLGFDDEKIYVAFYAYDREPGGIVARQTKRGTRIRGDDQVAFSIDPFHTHQSRDRSFFVVNPLGTQFARLGGERATKLEWEGEWQAAARVVEDGWTAEMAIPWAILNYPALKGPTTCGINFDRRQERTKIHSWWSNIGVQEQNERDGHWVGVEFPPFRPRLSLLPYASPAWDRGFGAHSGLDLRRTLTPSLTLVGTVNPDFRNIEEAVEGIDFSYGERFVEERRPFFLEGAAYYSSSGAAGQFFYSRRIGAFDTGVNLYGKLTPRDSLGVLAAIDIGRRYDWVVRGRHDLGPTSSVGVTVVNRDGEGPSNRVVALGQTARRKFWGLNTVWAGSWLGDGRAGDTGNIGLYYWSPRWWFELAGFYVSPGFRNDLGFIPFTDFKGFSTDLEYTTEWRRGPLRRLHAEFETETSDRYDGSLFRRRRQIELGVDTRSDHELQFRWEGGRFEEYDDSVFRIGWRARESDPFHNFGFDYSWGRRAGAPIRFLTPSVTWRFGESLTLGVASAILRHREDAEQHILTFNYDFSPQRGIGGRVVSERGSTNAYLSYRRSGYGGVETFLILGDPNARSFRARLATKVVWPL